MAFESIITESFENEHETDQFESLTRNLREVFEDSDEPHYLFGNVICDGTEVDAIFVKRTAFCLIEMKSMGGKVVFAENGPWTCDGRNIMAGRHSNPYRQVNAYRHTVRSLLNRWERIGELQPVIKAPWGHISTFVVFGPATSVEGEIPENIAKWFQIADLETIGDELFQVSSPLFDLQEKEFDFFLKTFGGVSHDQKGQHNGGEIGKLVFDRKADIGRRLDVLRVRKGLCLDVARKFEDMLRDPDNWAQSLEKLPSQRIKGIAGAQRYQIAAGHSLVVLSNKRFSCPLIIGIDHTVDQWIDSNRGITYVIDPDEKISKTFIDGKGDTKPLLTNEKISLFDRIEIDLEAIVPDPRDRDGLLKLHATSSDEDIDRAVMAVRKESVRSLLSDLLFRIRSGDMEGANARLTLFYGDSIEVDEIEGSGINREINSDTLVEAASLSPKELQRILEPENFEEWMVYLHPDQRQIAHAEYQQRALVTGVSGSGKTCVLVHRARHLAAKYPGQRIGILTLNRNLSHLLNNLVSSLCTEEERENISVHASYDYFKSLVDHFGPDREIENLKALGEKDPEFGAEFVATLDAIDRSNCAKPFDPVYSEAAQLHCWESFLQRPLVRTLLTFFSDTLITYAPNIDAVAYLREEFSLIRSGCLTENREEEYLALERVGRAIPLRKKDRLNVLRLLLLFEENMIENCAMDELGLTLFVTPHMMELSSLPEDLKFRCLLIDEFQDLSTRDLAVLQRIVPAEKDALFLTGDMVQQVMVKTLSLPKVGFMRGAYDSARIYKNYRNSREILLAAHDLVLHFGEIANQQNDEITILDPEFASRETKWPRAIPAVDRGNEIEIAWQLAWRCIQEKGVKPWSICVVSASPDQLSVEDIIQHKPSDLPFGTIQLTGNYAATEHAVTVGNMSDVKGFEFLVIIIVGCGAAGLPAPGRVEREVWRDALRLYVAMTRARDEVYLVYSGEPSGILTSMNAHMEWETTG